MKPTEMLVLSGIWATAVIAGLVVGTKYNHPVVGAVIGMVGGSFTATAVATVAGWKFKLPSTPEPVVAPPAPRENLTTGARANVTNPTRN